MWGRRGAERGGGQRESGSQERAATAEQRERTQQF